MQNYVRKSGRTLERLQNSVNGNPRYRVTFADGTCYPMGRDLQVGYTIGNPEFDGDVWVQLHRGEIVDVIPAAGDVA
jgi:hypothetical protein